jgi:type II secretory pathway pseudopilin PulG
VIARLREQQGFTLIEVLLACSLMIVVLTATLTVFEQFVTTSNRNATQNDAQDSARFTVDQLARQLRNLALPTPQSPNSIDVASPYDLLFKTADPGRRRVRYCLQTTSPYSTSNGGLWMQTQAGVAGGADPPLTSAMTATCPAATGSGSWATKKLVAARVTNLNGGSRPIFQFNAPTSTLSKITGVHVSIFLDVNPTRPPAETRISTGVFLRNQNQAPTAAFTISPAGNGRFLMNAANSSDPEGRTLGYFWYRGATPSYANAVSTGACNAADGCINKGILNDYTLPNGTTTSQVFTLLVKDPGGLTATAHTTCSPTGSSWSCQAVTSP